MKKVLASMVVIATIIASCNSSSGDKPADPKKDKYEQTKETLEETEKKNPTRFLSVTGHDRRNFFRQRVVKGSITNKASVATYKDIEVEISYYSKTGTFLLSSIDVVYEEVKPGTSVSFKNTEYAPVGTDSVALKILNAKHE